MFIINKKMNFKNLFRDKLHFSGETKKRITIAILIVILLAIIIVVYVGISNSSRYRNNSNSTVEENKLHLIDETINKVKFDVNFLNYLENFEIYGIRPSGEFEKGKENPFLEN